METEMELRYAIAEIIAAQTSDLYKGNVRPSEVADRILAIPEIAEALARPKPVNSGYTVITGTGKGNRSHVPPSD
jgi:hypothetical protein